jgi:superfamily I DNA/RNA helicase
VIGAGLCKKDDVKNFLLAADRFQDRYGEEATLKNFVERLLLADSQDTQAPGEGFKKNEVTLMTLHASKGLEFFTVFLVGAEDGILPHERAIAEGGVEEERRLFYVAITRAKQRLFISHCGFRARGANRGRERDRTQSRFLADIPKEFVVHSEAAMESAEVKKMASARRLFDLFR